MNDPSPSVIPAAGSGAAELGIPVLAHRAQAFGAVTVEWERLGPFDLTFRNEHACRLTFVLDEGCLTQTVGPGARRAPYGAGDLLVSLPGATSGYRWTAPLEILGLLVDSATVAEVAAATGGGGGHDNEWLRRGVPPVHDPLFFHLARSLRAELEISGPASRLMVESAVQIILLTLRRQAVGSCGRAAARPVAAPDLAGAAGTLPAWRLRRVQQFVEASLTADLSLAQLADAAGGMSPFHFLRLFRRTTGLTPFRYLTQQRIARAKGLLRTQPELSLGQVAADCGFRDQSAFCRVLRRLEGTSPKAFRDAGR